MNTTLNKPYRDTSTLDDHIAFERNLIKRGFVADPGNGASGHCAAMSLNFGLYRYLVTGDGIRREYGSVIAAYASYRAAWKSRSIWQVLPSGKRRLLFRD